MLVQADAKALEWRVLAWLANDALAIDELLNSPDIHEGNKKHFNLPERVIAKRYLFRTIFRGSGWAFAKDPEFNHVSTDPDFWEDLNTKFYKKYKRVDQCHTKWAQLVAQKQPIVSPFGREWLIPIRDDGQMPWTVLSNYPVQGTGQDLMTIARISLLNRLRQKNYSTKLVTTVHDSVAADCPNNEVDNVVELMYNVFNDIPKNVKKLFGIDLPIPFPAEVKVGPNLLHMTEVKYVCN